MRSLVSLNDTNMNGIANESRKSLLNVAAQLIIILSIFEILVLITNNQPESNVLWVAGSGLIGLITGAAVLHIKRSGNVRNSLGLICLSIVNLCVCLFVMDNFSDVRMFIDLFISSSIFILLLKE
jgi:hypothetical protein